MLLLVLLSVLHLAPLVTAAEDGDTNVPVCCRAHGKHACATHMGEPDSKPAMGRLVEPCPFEPASPVPVHGESFAPGTAAMIFAGLVSHPACRPQTAAIGRIAFARTRQKRGPPARSLAA